MQKLCKVTQLESDKKLGKVTRVVEVTKSHQKSHEDEKVNKSYVKLCQPQVDKSDVKLLQSYSSQKSYKR